MDGVGNGDHTPYLVDLVNQGSVIIPDFDSPIPERWFQPELPYHLYVPGSETAEYQLFGKNWLLIYLLILEPPESKWYCVKIQIWT